MRLTRFGLFEDRTIGRLEHDGQTYWTVERPWLDNQPNISCIPLGVYQVRRTNSPKFGPNMWEIVDVPGRTHILLHVANTSRDVLGCIGLGQSVYGDLTGVGSSKKAIEAFYEQTQADTELLMVIDEDVLR